MKRSKELLTALVNENYLKTKEIIHEELYSKVGSAIDGIREDAYAVVFNEAKKAKKTDDEDDGDGLDPVGAEDSDVDNDGDSDESDDYLNNRRKTVGKAIKKKKNGDDEDEELDESSAGDLLKKVLNPFNTIARGQRDAAQAAREKKQSSPEGISQRARDLAAARRRRTGTPMSKEVLAFNKSQAAAGPNISGMK
tara:strand:+ start:2283 stop:2867 length:585 start_codon:yes stop_codon:yes gene_type:complete